MERRQDLVEAKHGTRPLLVLCGDLNSCVCFVWLVGLWGCWWINADRQAPVDPFSNKHSVPGTAAIRMLLGEGVPNTDPVWAGIGEFGWSVWECGVVV